VPTTRTIGPLHLEDLEPHRFEDLIRQLIYDFRNWRRLEATGRSGSDDGFDIRGIEIGSPVEPSFESAEDQEESEPSAFATQNDRVWLIQCKREKSINPKKLVGYLETIPEKERADLYGIIFAAACDFSKKARDAFRVKVQELGFAEAYLWGKGEIEDMLFQPKNDHLLFAYLGVSLQLRRRSLKTEVRSRLAAKRKALRCLQGGTPALIRDATDDRYPFLDPDKFKPREERGRWAVLTCRGCFSDGIRFVVRRHFAYLDDDGERWDYAELMDDGRVDDRWRDDSEHQEMERRSAAMTVWDSFPKQTKAWYEVLAVLAYENILDIDERGDEYFDGPHIYTTEFIQTLGPFRYFIRIVETIDSFDARQIYPSDETRVDKFPRAPKAKGDS
jgi:hypothetical protein